MNVLSVPVIMMASVSFYVGFYHLFVYYRRRFKHREDLTFALMCLMVGMYDIFSIGMYNCTSVEKGIFWQRAQVVTLSFIGVVFVWFSVDYLGLKLKRIRNVFSAYFLFSALIILIDRSPFTFDITKPHIKETILPFNLKVTYYEVVSGPFTDITGIIGVLFMLFILFISARTCRQENMQKSRAIFISFIFFLAGLCNDIAVLTGLYDFIYMIEYAYMAIILLMAYTLSNTVVESAMVKDALAREQYLMQSLMNTITDNIYFKDNEGRFIRINKSLANWFGIKNPDEAISKTDFDFFSDEHAQQTYIDELKIMQTGKPLIGYEEKETWFDGRETWVSTTKAPLLDVNKNIVGTFGISRDITDRKQAEEALRKAKAELDQKARILEKTNQALIQSNKELQQFAYVASHDLQEPLRMISSYLSLLVRRYKDTLDSTAREFIDFTVDGAQRMQVMINDLLQYSRITTRGKPFEKTEMEQVLQTVFMNLKVAIDESKAEITHDVLPVVLADRLQMERLLQNLIGNAIKYKDNGKPKVHISVKKKKEEYTFSIQDNGIGIEDEFQERIFGIFQRLHTREEYSGTGIGLAICKKIVERHGGRIWVDSEIDKGSTFYFTIQKKSTQISAGESS